MSPYSINKAWLYFQRSILLRCPVCGISPLFLPARKTKSFTDFFTTLPGCPYCGCTFEREPGYFLFATGFVNFSVAGVVGTTLFLLLSSFSEISNLQLLVYVLLPAWVVSLLSVRHAEALFLACDYFFDPDFEEVDLDWPL